ncbi:hypothetical protein CVV68_12940 [Arthrobacter livingstonensis]|uniref:Uncharacterized protein n=1 Tax=Arthrobacter livingstonensis TaxID=670078 RepID=A0A2V5L5D0_9MICC|nr:hypothetical protein [Arthrobacter livingstonensis]PYI66711.1 hypothetical protein CVV68_12940 [Arthrobacter livingstonensis]
MESLTNADAGDWLRPLLDTEWHDMHAVVPRGFPAYARIFHPVGRDRPADTGTWHGHDRTDVFPLQTEEASWCAVARAFGTEMHPLAQFHRVLGQASNGQEIMDAEGWRYSEPLTGNLAPEILAAATVHLCEHTSTPEQGVSAIWEGWGGLASSAGYAQLTFSGDGIHVENTVAAAVLGSGPGSGLLPASVVNGGTPDLPGRAYYLFNAAPQFYLNSDWVNHVPWHHSPEWPQSPNILWPADRKWVLVTEIDFDSTVVAGSPELISALVRDPIIEALPLREGADLTWDADAFNRPAK